MSTKITPQLRFPEFTDEWQVKKLGDTVKFEQGVQVDLPQQKPTPFEDSVKFLRIENYTQKSQDFRYISKKIAGKKYINDDEVAVVRYGATAGFIATGQSGVLANNLFSVRSNGDSISNKFLSLRLKQPRTYSYFQSEMSGGAMPALSFSIVSRYKFAFPSKPEQEKIADFLTAVDERIGVGEKKLELLQKYKKGVMQKIFTRQIRFKDENGNPYPEWEEKRLGDVADFVNGYTFLSSTYVEGGKYKVITIANVQQGAMNADSANTIDLLPANIQTSQILHLGDILISMTGNVGRVCMVDAEDCLLNQRVGKLVPRDINKDYLYQSINTPRFVSKMISSGQGGAQDNLSSKDIKGYDIALPTPEEQQKIATFLTALDDKIAAEQTRLTAAEQWRRGLLQRMFE